MVVLAKCALRYVIAFAGGYAGGSAGDIVKARLLQVVQTPCNSYFHFVGLSRALNWGAADYQSVAERPVSCTVAV
jgi:hypothetical protein